MANLAQKLFASTTGIVQNSGNISRAVSFPAKWDGAVSREFRGELSWSPSDPARRLP